VTESEVRERSSRLTCSCRKDSELRDMIVAAFMAGFVAGTDRHSLSPMSLSNRLTALLDDIAS